MITSNWRALAAAGGALALAACSAGPAHVGSAPHSPAATAAQDIEAAFGLLMSGEEGAARKKLKAVLKREPMNAAARLLDDSLSGDPKELLGPQSYSYSARPGDTLPNIAQRLLGNRLKAYQLLRYNGLKAPAALAAGQIIRIPGQPPRPEPVRRPEPAQGRAVPVSPTPRAATPAPQPPRAPANAAAARQQRTAGLAALNQGNVDRAIALLRRAAQLDPANPAIARDLARAERIAATVRARK